VVESAAGQPLADARVIFWSEKEKMIVARVETDASGSYEVEVKGDGTYWVYASCDYPSTPGFDYVPASRKVSVGGGPLNVSFTLLPGASIVAVGEVRLAGISPMRKVSFSVDTYGPPSTTDFVTWYGDYSTDSLRLNLSSRVVVVPSGMPVKVSVYAYFWSKEYKSGWYEDYFSFSFTIDDNGDWMNLAQGDLLSIDLPYSILQSYANTLYTILFLPTQVKIDKAEEAGFYVYYERARLSRAENLLNFARSALKEGDYDGASASLYEALFIFSDVMGALMSMCVNAPQSIFFITPFLGFTAVAVASILFEGRRRRLFASLALYGVLFGLLFVLYPGYSLLRREAYNLWVVTAPGDSIVLLSAVVSFFVPLLLILELPRVYRERTSMEGLRSMSAVVAAFSVAARNLKRRRLRTLLTATFMLISVFAFTTLTSLSFEEGFTIQPKSGQAPSEGFLIQKPLVGQSTPFEPIEPEILEWLEERSEVVLVTPKLENTPLVVSEPSPPPLGVLYAPESNMSFSFSGVLGVYPSLEAQVTKMGSIIVRGRFLSDEDLSGILISEEVAGKLQAEPNSTLELYGQKFNLTGIFDGERLGGLKDLDGMPLIPQYVFMWVLEGVPSPPIYTPYYVPSEGVIIVHGEKAKSLPKMVISRVDVQTQDPNDIMALARLAVLIWPDVEAFASVAGKIQHLFVGTYGVAKGFIEATVPLALVVLNVGVMMMSAVYERKREVATMSCVGLNPSHITAVFVAEALVIGVVAGSLGYFLGLTSYRLMALFFPLGVKQKVEAIWGILALCFSIGAAVLGTAIPALKASITATPSLIRRWKIRLEEKPKTAGEPWVLGLPIQIPGEELERFFGFVERRLREYAAYPYSWIDNLKVSGRGAATRLTFTYTYTMERGIVTENELFPVESPPDRYAVKLASRTRRGSTASIDEADIRQTANFIRQLILQYSHVKDSASKPPSAR